MSILKSIVSVFTLLAFSIVIGLSIQAQQQTNRNNARQVSNILQRLERSSSRFRNSLNVGLVQVNVDQTRPQNDISTFESELQLAIKQFRDQFTRRLAVATDVESILQKASPINSFVSHNTLNPRVKNDWSLVRTDLNTLASVYAVNWQWNQLTPMKVDANGSFRLSETELNQLIQRVENGGAMLRHRAHSRAGSTRGRACRRARLPLRARVPKAPRQNGRRRCGRRAPRRRQRA